MIIKTNCPNPSCGKKLKISDAFVGRQAACPECKFKFTVKASDGEEIVPEATAVESEDTADSLPQNTPFQETRLTKETLTAIFRSCVLIAACVILQTGVNLLPGSDLKIGRLSIAGWTKAGLAIVITVFLLCLLSPLKTAAHYYIDLIFKSNRKLAEKPELRQSAASAGVILVLLAYLAVLYWTFLPSFFSVVNLIIGYSQNFMKLARLGFLLATCFLVIRLVLNLKPLFSQVTEGLAGSVLSATKKAALKNCSSCEAKISPDVQFCPKCGQKQNSEAI